MSDPNKKPETDATGTGNAGAAAKPAGAVAAAAKEAKAGKPSKVVQEAMDALAPPPTVVVTGPEKGRWRIGRKFTREPSSIPVGELSAAEMEALSADPELHVQIIDAPH